MIETENEAAENIEDDILDIFGLSPVEPYEDSGSEYVPEQRSRSSSRSLQDILGDSSTENNEEGQPSFSTNKDTRKRMRKESLWKKNVRKNKRARGEAYVNTKGVLIPAKQIDTGLQCTCNQKCHDKIVHDRQKQLFSKFYALANFDLQSAYLYSLIHVVIKARSYVRVRDTTSDRVAGNVTSKPKEFSRLYHLPEANGKHIRVCKSFFKQVFKVSDGRLTRVLKNKPLGDPAPIDKRGRHIPSNKTPETKVNEVKDFINTFPKYDSHYTRHKSESRQYLPPHLNLSIMYSEYKSKVAGPVSKYIFEKIFNENFNLTFHAPVTDSCKRCDNFKVKIDACDNNELSKKNELTIAKELHLRKAESAMKNLKLDMQNAKQDNDTTVIIFDLMKTLPTPVISTGICYYKRQLWTYCLGIHNAGTDEMFMYVWDESTASRGPQEIGSCLLKFIREHVHTKRLIMYSDQCGGQNRNIKVAALCMHIVSSPQFTVENIDHKFTVSGHSFSSCDRAFGLVEKQKKYFPDIYVPEHWNNVILAARKKKPFKIVEMKGDDFISTKALETNITNRKIGVDRSKVEWLKIQWLLYNKSHPFSMFFKYSNEPEVLFAEVNFSKRSSKDTSNFELEILFPEGRKISHEKKKDLLCLLEYVPPIYHPFYEQLKVSSNAGNELDGAISDSSTD
ncbi:uncharacterized protein LOC120637854 isoform X2 [Pararge aegeria]|uniref:uncharacterized protein LOC120624514 isoform X2 n=1 Tax=Pararge aegeria TaxID=116150 RepID=UPI0019D03865|nr:uncharacterized protein LOC120624514 isoform X2 [Pararge aegeria]XP_039747569.1 uncharacterized protein LOC120624876 isoform X2 [Pararge aegeria]XP_039750320.1 uncharacterized protein LOC120626727 isoform X2 [Pararge aegeria]XP_039751386.1 uncharacterized protein LOC120627447 isoform X2 [Pararge aegeria]XP_039753254.1 uncharacterized protein LOC120628731 isoform X2 [Pararge aegeria]XP_039753860.1 uncharacterized protein LOC120629133 isoform X2 [Pararge aegeria]XP_039756322.1 uncharacterize